MHIILTQNAHTQHTEHKIQQYAAHSTEHRTEHREQYKQSYTISTHSYSTYSFDFYDEHIYIKKLYNTAIYKLYTNYIHFGHLIDEVSKITNIDILK